MRNTEVKIERKSFYGNSFETQYLYKDLYKERINIQATEDLLGNIDISQRDFNVKHPYFRNVDKSLIANFLLKLQISQDNQSFDVQQLSTFIKSQLSNNFFDVLVIGGESNIVYKNERLKIDDLHIVVRKFDFKNDDIIRINAQRAHLWGTSDTKYGLTKEQISNLPEQKKSQDYLIEGRNPILIIYFLDLNNKVDEDFYANGFDKDRIQFMNFHLEMKNFEYKYLVGFSIGFPKNSYFNAENNDFYVVNRSVNYYSKDHIDEEDGYE